MDTLVYQLEDADPHVRLLTLQKLRKVAAVESSHFPVRNPRRFLHCVRRRIVDDLPGNALEALRLVADVMPALGHDLDQILASLLPHLVPCLPRKEDDQESNSSGLVLQEETFQVFRKYAVLANDLQAVAELLMNIGLAHASARVREASLVAIIRLLDERFARTRSATRTASRADKALFVALTQAIIPVLEDESEQVVVVAEEVLGKLQVYWGDRFDDVMQFLSSEDKQTLRDHQDAISDVVQAATGSLASLMSLSGSSSIQDSSRGSQSSLAVHFNFVPDEIVGCLRAEPSTSNSDWKRRSMAAEKLLALCKEVDTVILRDQMNALEELFDILIRLMQDSDTYLVKRSLQIIQVLFHHFSLLMEDEFDVAEDAIKLAKPQHYSAFYMEKLLPHLVEVAGNFGEGDDMEACVYAVLAQLFQGGFSSIARSSQALMGSLQHRRVQIREEAIKVWMVLLLIGQQNGFAISKIISQNTVQALGRLLGDPNARVRDLTFEAAAVVAAVTRSDLVAVLTTHLDEFVADRVDMEAVERRILENRLPAVRRNGTLRLSAPVLKVTRSLAVERSLGGISELHELADQQSEAQAFINHDSHYGFNTGAKSIRSRAMDAAPNVTHRNPNTNVVTGGSLSDRSYFLKSPRDVSSTPSSERSDAFYSSNSKSSEDSAGATSKEHISDKLAVLKKKTTLLRKSASTKQVNSDPSSLVQVEKDVQKKQNVAGTNNEPVRMSYRSATPPERLKTPETTRMSTASRQKDHYDAPKSRRAPQHDSPSPDPLVSPQKMQQLQSEAASLPFEDRPIQSKYAETNRDVEEADNGHNDINDRPIRGMSDGSSYANLAEYPESSAVVAGNNDSDEKPSKPVAMSLATRKRLEAKQRQEQQQQASPIKDSMQNADCNPNATTSIGARKRFGAAQISVQEQDTSESLAKPKMSAKSKIPSFVTQEGNRSGKQDPKYLEPHELKPLVNPKQEVTKVLAQLPRDDWELNFEALTTIRRLATHHSAVLDERLHAVVTETLKHVLNLRSSVSKNALLAIESMCAALRRSMDAEVDNVVPLLMKRCADSNTFVCESVTSALQSVILHCSTGRVVNAMAAHLNTKSVPIRREVARGIHTVIVGLADQIQTSKELSSIMAIVGKCLDDSNNEVRDAAKQSVLYLHQQQRISTDRLKKMLPPSTHTKVDQLVSGKMALIPSAASFQPSMVAVETTEQSLRLPKQQRAGNEDGPKKYSVTAASKKAAASMSSAVDMDKLVAIQAKLDSSNWNDRFDALQDATKFICASASALCETGKILTLFDAFVKRMEDGNAKVNVLSLECLDRIIPAMGNGMDTVLSNFMPVLAKNLAANNSKLASLALGAMELLCLHVDARLLYPHITSIARHSNSRVKPLLIQTLEKLTLQSRGPDDKTVFALNRYVLPLALELIKEAKSDVKDANTRLLRALYAALGSGMLPATYKLSTAQQDRLQSILGI